MSVFQNNGNFILNDGWHAFYSLLEADPLVGGCGLFGDPEWLSVDCNDTHGYMCKYTEGKLFNEFQHDRSLG